MAPLFQQPFMSGGFPSMNRAVGAVGGWVELARTTLGSAGDTITVSSLSDKRYYMLLGDYLPSGNINGTYRMNNDTGTNYAGRNSGNGAADTTATSQTYFQTDTIAGNNYEQFDVGYVANLSSKEKLIQMWTHKHDGNGAATVTKRIESVGKWANTSNAINRFDTVNIGTGDFASGSELVVLGWDPADSHTNNFWEELGSQTLSSTATSISLTGLAEKKYIWLQYAVKGHTDVSLFDLYLRVGDGSIATSNYSWRESTNGAGDSTSTSTNRMLAGASYLGNGEIHYGNVFIINNSANEKLAISHIVSGNTAGSASAPNRRETVGKYAYTSGILDSFEIGRNSGSGNLAVGSELRVWGAD